MRPHLPWTPPELSWRQALWMAPASLSLGEWAGRGPPGSGTPGVEAAGGMWAPAPVPSSEVDLVASCSHVGVFTH